MTRETLIKEAANKYIDIWSNGTYCAADPMNAFIEGADWADSNPQEGVVNLSKIWHDYKEPPEEGRQVLGIDYDGDAGSGVFGCYPLYGIFLCDNLIMDWDEVVKWVYIEDLLPKGGDK